MSHVNLKLFKYIHGYYQRFFNLRDYLVCKNVFSAMYKSKYSGIPESSFFIYQSLTGNLVENKQYVSR